MLKRLKQRIFRRDSLDMKAEIDPDEIFLDSSNLPEFNIHRFEGTLERPLGRLTFIVTAAAFLLIGLLFIGRSYALQVKGGEYYRERSENNSLKHTVYFANRGLILDRNENELAWNELNSEGDFSFRRYIPLSGFSHLLGFVKYPSKDSKGIYYEENFIPQSGVEEYYNNILSGINGIKITETNVGGEIQSESVLNPPKDGQNIKLSIDVEIQNKLYEYIRGIAGERGFSGGAGVIMDVRNGEILAITSFPEFNSNLFTSGEDTKAIKNTLNDKNNPFLNRAVSGLYIPGSIIKPFLAIAALEENIIDPLKKILSVGQIEIPNPYDKTKKTIFRDWKVHGWVDMRHAISVSSDEYFYTIGGGYKDQKGLGIDNIEKYMKMFGFGSLTSSPFSEEKEGNVPSIKWKEENFAGDPWRVGDTYNSSIGQYGFQVTALQVVRAIAAIANDGTLLRPEILLNSDTQGSIKIPISYDFIKIIKEGMRLSVLEGTASALNLPQINVAAKTGTAELGTTKQAVNSWVTGYFPYENPRYAFAAVMEKCQRSNTVGASYVMRQLLEWLSIYKPEYIN